MQREALAAQARQLSSEMAEVSRQGDQVRGKIRAILNGKLGFTDDRLVRYGFEPRRVPRRQRRSPEPVSPPTTPAPVELQGPPAAPPR